MGTCQLQQVAGYPETLQATTDTLTHVGNNMFAATWKTALRCPLPLYVMIILFMLPAN